MPIFEYLCKGCGHRFEAMVPRASARPECPACSGRKLAKQFSAFAVGGRGPSLAARESAGPCGPCGDPRGPGACSLD